MPRLSLSIGRNRESSENHPKSRHLRNSIKDFFGRHSTVERASIDLGDLSEEEEEEDAFNSQHNSSSSHTKPTSTSHHQGVPYTSADVVIQSSSPLCTGDVCNATAAGEAAVNQHAAITKGSAEKLSKRKSTNEKSFSTVSEYAVYGTGNVSVDPGTSPSVSEHEKLALENYSIAPDSPPSSVSPIGDSPRNARNNEKRSSWRRHGSFLGSRLVSPLVHYGGSGGHNTPNRSSGSDKRSILRKESAPSFNLRSVPKQYHRNIFKRSDSSDDVNRISKHHNENIDSGSQEHSNTNPLVAAGNAVNRSASRISRERSQCSSSAPHLVPMVHSPSHSHTRSIIADSSSHGMRYYRENSGSKLNQKGLKINFLKLKPSNERFPRPTSTTVLDSMNTPGTASSPVPFSTCAERDPGTPMTFLVASRPRSNTASKHEIQSLGHQRYNSLSKSSINAQDFSSAACRKNSDSKNNVCDDNNGRSRDGSNDCNINNSSSSGINNNSNPSSSSSSTPTSNSVSRSILGYDDFPEFGVRSTNPSALVSNNSSNEPYTDVKVSVQPGLATFPYQPRGAGSISGNTSSFEPLNEEPEDEEPKTSLNPSTSDIVITSSPPSLSQSGGTFGPTSAQNNNTRVSILESAAYHRSLTSPEAPSATPSIASRDEICEQDGVEASENGVHETHHMAVDYDPYTGRKMINQYMIIRELGRGTHGKVKLAFDTTTGEYYAIKIIDKMSQHKRLRPLARGRAGRRSDAAPYLSSGNGSSVQRRKSSLTNPRIDFSKMEKVKREIAILKKCQHPNVVRLHEVIDDAHARRIYLVIEYMDCGEIVWRDSSNLPVLSAPKARQIFRDLVLGVEYLHHVGILHRDLKPQNLLCNKAGTVKISDFGVSFLSRRMSKRNLNDGVSGKRGSGQRQQHQHSMHTKANYDSADSKKEKQTAKHSRRNCSSQKPSSSAVKSTTGYTGSRGFVCTPSPLRPAGHLAAIQGSGLHRYASQPLINTKSPIVPISERIIFRKGSSAMQTERTPNNISTRNSNIRSGSGSDQSLTQCVNSYQLNIGMTDDFGLRKNSLPTPTTISEGAKGSFSAVSGAAGFDGKPIAYILPPELSSADSNVYDPFDSSDTDEFFSSDSESDYGDEYNKDDMLDSDSQLSDESADGIVFGTPSKSIGAKKESDDYSNELNDDAVVPNNNNNSDSKNGNNNNQHIHRQGTRGTLGEISVVYSEEDEERELAKTAGTPAFFAPELCSTPEELTNILRERMVRKKTHDKLNGISPLPVQRIVSEQSAAMLKMTTHDKTPRPISFHVINEAASLGRSGDTTSPSRSRRRLTSLITRKFTASHATLKNETGDSEWKDGDNKQQQQIKEHDVNTTTDCDEFEPLPKNVVTAAIDIWAMGVTLYCLIYGRVPFKATTEFELFNIIPRQELEFPDYIDIMDEDEDEEEEMGFGNYPFLQDKSQAEKAPRTPSRRIKLPPLDANLRDLLCRLLDKDFRTRITIEEIKNHPWVIEGLARPSSWVKSTDPMLIPEMKVTTQEVEHAMVPKLQPRGFRASVRRRLSRFSSKCGNSRGSEEQQQQNLSVRRHAKNKSSLDWLKIW